MRDPRTLLIEMLFPIIFIFTGLALATIKPIREGVARPLSPSIFPQPSHLYYNDKIPAQGISAAPLVDSYFNKTLWSIDKAVVTDISDPLNYTHMVSQLDDALYSDATAMNGFYGSYFLYNLNDTGADYSNYAAFALINATSQDAIAAYGA